MFSKYFEQLEKKILKTAKAARKTTGKESAGKKKTAPAKYDDLLICLNNLIPAHLKLAPVKIIDSGGYSPDGVDLVAYREIFRDLDKIMDGYIPAEIAYGTFHICQNLNSKSLEDILKNVVQAKKINRFTEDVKEDLIVPAFIIAYKSGMSLPEIKNSITDYYMTRGIDYLFEFDLIMILGLGVIVKDWKEKRSFIAIETGKDTLKWFFMLMNEYMDIERGNDLDLRSYVKRQEKYNEY